MFFFLSFSFQFKIGLCQLSVTSDKDNNIARARTAIHDAAVKGAKLVLLPVSFFFLMFVFRNAILILLKLILVWNF